jgi:hypothetical protein
MHRIAQFKICCECRQIVGVVVEIVTVIDLAGTAMPTPVVSYNPETTISEEYQLGVPVVARQWPAVTEHYRLASTPIFVEELYAILRLYYWHRSFIFHCASKSAGAYGSDSPARPMAVRRGPGRGIRAGP